MDGKRSKSKSKSSIPTAGSSVKSSTKSRKDLPKKHEEQKKSSKKPKEVRIVKPETPVVSNDYEDDFEEYEDDFEDSVSEDPDHKLPSSQKEQSRPNLPKTASPTPDYFKEEEEEEEEEAEEEVVESENEEETRKDSFLLNRINNRSDVPNNNLTTSLSTRKNEQRPATSANRVFRFDIQAAPNTETLLLSLERFKKLKSEGSLAINFIQSMDIPPNRASDIFNNLVGNPTSSQRYTQTGDDSLENCSQTTPRERADKANQCPSIFVKTDVKSQKDAGDFPVTTERFLKFVGISGRTLMSLLTSNKEQESVHLPLRPNVEFSVGFAQFALDKIAKKYKAIGIEITRKGFQKILVGFYVEDSEQRSLIDKSILLEYTFSNMEDPTNVYLTSDEVTDFSYSSDGRSLLFAGQRSGNCLLWDQLNRNQGYESENIPQINGKLVPQLPAYSTAYICVERRKRAFTYQPDQSIIQTKALKINDSSGQQQFVSLDFGGSVTIWAAVRDQSTVATNNDDLGLDFTSLVRLIRISSTICSATPFGAASQATTCLDIGDSEELIVGTTQGAVVRVCRSHQNEQRLRRYSLGPSRLSANAVCYCPQDPRYFAAGTSGGSILIFKVDQPDPVLDIQLKETRSYRVNQLTNLLWSHIGILYALYDSKYFAIWDPSSSINIEPEIVDLASKFGSRILKMSLCGTSYITFTLTSGMSLVHELHHVSSSSVASRGVDISKVFKE